MKSVGFRVCILLKSKEQLVMWEVMFCIGLLKNLNIFFKAWASSSTKLFSTWMKS